MDIYAMLYYVDWLKQEYTHWALSKNYQSRKFTLQAGIGGAHGSRLKQKIVVLVFDWLAAIVFRKGINSYFTGE